MRRRVALAVVPRWRALGRWRSSALAPQVVAGCRAAYPWAMRIALSVVYFWFGFVKLLGLSQATPLAKALTAQTVGAEYFDTLFVALAVIECIIGVIVVFPRLRNVALPAIAVHMGIVCAPLVLVPQHAWQSFLVPTLEGQYIIKNVLVVAAVLALGAGAESRAEHQAEHRLDVDRRPRVADADTTAVVRRRASWLDRLALAASLTGVTVAAIALWTTVHDAPTVASASSRVVSAVPTTSAAPAAVAAPEVAVSVAAGVPAPASGEPVTLEFSAGVLTLRGSVGSEAERALVVSEAEELLAVSSTVDELVIAEGAPTPHFAVRIPAAEVFEGDSAIIRLDFSASILRVASEAKLHGQTVVDVTVRTEAEAAAIHEILTAQGIASERIALHATEGADDGTSVTIALEGLI